MYVTSSGADVNPGMMLWMFAVGGVISVGMPEWSWFVNHLVGMTGEIGCSDLGGLEGKH